MTKFYTLLLIVCSATFFSCKTASKAYDKGDYEKSIDLSIKKLQKDPNDGETKASLMAAYKNAVDVSESTIRSLSTGTNISYDRIYSEYFKLQSLYEKLRPYPELVKLVRATDYTGFVKTYGDKAAEAHYEMGVQEMDKDTKPAYRQAYREFKTALRYADNRQTREKMEEAYSLAVTNVVIIPASSHMQYYQYNTSYAMQNFQDELLRDLRRQSSEFLKIYSEWDARNKNITPDQIVELRVGRFDIGRPYDRNQTKTVSKEVVVKEIVYKPDSVVKQYGTVTAQVTSTKRTLASEGELYLTVTDNQGRVIWTDRIKGEHQWQTEFATYRGDERALSEADRAQVNQSGDNNIPKEDAILDEILRKIRNDAQYRLRTFFSRYD
jgi:tetratricopeptide (TPR) repeat protein